MMRFSTFLFRQTPAWIFIPVLLVVFFSLSYCTEKDSSARRSVEDLRGYVKTTKEKADSTFDEQWDKVEKEYDEKKAQASKHANNMEAELKESYNETVKEWDEYKLAVKEKQELRQKEKEARLLRSSLAPAGILPDLSNVTSANIASVYEHFIGVVEKNKETYSKEEWININNYWQSLNDIRDRLDKSKAINSADNKKIRGIKTKYAATKALNKPFAPSEENQ